MDFSGLQDLCIPVLVCDGAGVIKYKNRLGRKRFPFLYVGNAITRHVIKDDRDVLKATLQTGAPGLILLTHKELISGRGLAMQLAEDAFLVVFFAELQPMLSDFSREKFLQSVPGLLEFFRALVDVHAEEQPMPSIEARLLAAEAHSGALAALLLEPDLIIGQSRFQVLSLFEELFIGLRSDLKHCGAQIKFQNHISPFAYRYSRSCLLPLSLVKLMLFALLTTKEKRIEVDLLEGVNHQPYFEVRFRSKRKLPIMQGVEDFRVFAARYPKLYPMLFGYLPALIDEGCQISLHVGEDGMNVLLRVYLTCDRDNTIVLSSAEAEAATLRVLRAILRYSTLELG